jgi:RimJ/RimL family protein N-acetyltransferase
MAIRLRPVIANDLPWMFAMQCDEESNGMAVVRPRSREAFDEHWQKALADPGVFARVIEADGECVGIVSCFKMNGHDSIGYWIDRPHWGRGFATQAVKLLLKEVTIRPLHAEVARSNLASQRVLERNGFTYLGCAWEPESERYPACETARYLLTAPAEA